jgi:tetratricopeptide (TPR) repeat protein
MAESIKSDQAIRAYLLGRIADEATLEEVEVRLFTDDDYCTQMELAEDEIINDYVLGRLSTEDAASFESTLRNDPDRRFKLELTRGLKQRALLHERESAPDQPSWLASLGSIFLRPAYAGAFAVLLIAAVVLTVYFTRRNNRDDLAELQSIYSQSRPTESRITNFPHAPLTQLRGAPDARDQNRLRRIENDLLDAVETSPNAQTHHALGVFDLTQRKYPEAIKELEAALKFGADARIQNDLGSAHFELAKAGPTDRKLEELAQSFEHFTKATQLDANLLEALFNRSLALQEMNQPRQAKESWTLYLQKDSSSPWADEARKHLANLPNEQSLFRTDAQVLSDFLAAFRAHDHQRAQQIHDETKGLLRDVTVPLQLCRRYLAAIRSSDAPVAKESLDALTFIGNFEQATHHDAFFLSWPTSI